MALVCKDPRDQLFEHALTDDSAFGGMVAFCVIVGDTIPKVMDALFPSLNDMSFLWLLTDRRAVMILLILGISYPLSLYRDIAKVGASSSTKR
jgi:sodium-coupled neutral amino acid transporter 11